jgi:ABC-2 type transport system permease protein
VRGSIWLVARREITTRVRGRLFRIVTILLLLAVAAAIVIPTKTKSKPVPQYVGVVGSIAAIRPAVSQAARSVATGVRFVQEANIRAAERDLDNGAIDLALVNARQIIVKQAITASDSSTTASLVQAVGAILGDDLAVGEARLSPNQLATLRNAKPLPVKSLERPPPPSKVHPVSVVGVIVTFIMLTQYLTWTLIGVMEEKTSRVVEVLLSALRPVQLLAGKVLGIGLVAMSQAALILLWAILVSKAVGSNLLKGTDTLEVLSSFLWLLLGYAFYSWVYATAGSMATRQDQVQSVAFPLSLPMVVGYITALLAASSGAPSAFVRVLAYLPPTAPFAMPVLVGFNAVSWWQFLISVLVSLACTYILAQFAALVYRRAVLRTGGRVRWSDVLSAEAR